MYVIRKLKTKLYLHEHCEQGYVAGFSELNLNTTERFDDFEDAKRFCLLLKKNSSIDTAIDELNLNFRYLWDSLDVNINSGEQ